MNPLRLFIAIDLGPEQARAVNALLDSLKKGVRFTKAHPAWVTPNNLHMTLKFLGSVDQTRLSEITQKIAPAIDDILGFRYCLQSLGVFPNPRQPSVLWLGVQEGRKELIHLANAIDSSLSAIGFEAERRPFHPHITLARIKSRVGVEALMSIVRSHENASIGWGVCDEVILYQSHLNPEGARYEALYRWPLAASSSHPGTD